MVCVYCGQKTQVTNSRLIKTNNQVWRRRRCQVCNSLITTVETPAYDSVLAVKRPDGRLEPFLRDKLLISLADSLGHRKTAANDASKLSGTIIQRLIDKSQNAIIDLSQIVSLTTTVLERFDPLAGQHYRAYHS